MSLTSPSSYHIEVQTQWRLQCRVLSRTQQEHFALDSDTPESGSSQATPLGQAIPLYEPQCPLLCTTVVTSYREGALSR